MRKGGPCAREDYLMILLGISTSIVIISFLVMLFWESRVMNSSRASLGFLLNDCPTSDDKMQFSAPTYFICSAIFLMGILSMEYIEKQCSIKAPLCASSFCTSSGIFIF